MDNGVVSFAIIVPEKLKNRKIGKAIITHALGVYGSDAKMAKASWNGGGDMADNYDAYMNEMNNKGDYPNADRSAAAFETPTGKILKKLGFTEARVMRTGLKQVEVYFSKPSVSPPSKSGTPPSKK